MAMSTIILVLFLFAGPFVSGSRPGDLVTALQSTYYDQSTGLWKSAGWWNSANSLEAIIEFMGYSKETTYANVIANTFAHTTAEETMSGSYDDEQWWAITWIKAYQLTHIEQYKNRAVILWNDILTNAWDNKCGGGVWWSSKKDYKNAITNELFLVLSMELHKIDNNATYLHWAAAEWAWFESTGIINQDNLINDGIDNNCKNNHQPTWTYNQGVILGGLMNLAVATKNNTLVTIAQKIADAAMTKLTHPNGILREQCEADGCGPDAPQFKGIFMRYLAFLTYSLPASPKKTTYTNWIHANADSIWNNDRNSQNLCGLIWIGPVQTPTAPTHTSALDCLNADMHLM